MENNFIVVHFLFLINSKSLNRTCRMILLQKLNQLPLTQPLSSTIFSAEKPIFLTRL